jgi:organic radical activating enzyme
MKYPLARNGIYWTIQGEGHLRGFQMCFLRLAGCSVGCPQCDTDYRASEVATEQEITERVLATTPRCIDPWCWITGGEPADHDLRPLIDALHRARIAVAVASSGIKRIIPPVEWLSISPHHLDFVQRYGNEIKLVPGLNQILLQDWEPDLDNMAFMYRYVQPLWVNEREDQESLSACKEWLKSHPSWALSRQDHKYWSLP